MLDNSSKDAIMKKLQEQVIDAFGPESTMACIFEDPDFIDKLKEVMSWLIAQLMWEIRAEELRERERANRDTHEVGWKYWHKDNSWKQTTGLKWTHGVASRWCSTADARRSYD